MATTAPQKTKGSDAISPWQGFRTSLWQNGINVRDFIQQNYTPYDGGADFLAPATPRTQALWNTLTDLFVEEPPTLTRSCAALNLPTCPFKCL